MSNGGPPASTWVGTKDIIQKDPQCIDLLRADRGFGEPGRDFDILSLEYSGDDLLSGTSQCVEMHLHGVVETVVVSRLPNGMLGLSTQCLKGNDGDAVFNVTALRRLEGNDHATEAPCQLAKVIMAAILQISCSVISVGMSVHGAWRCCAWAICMVGALLTFCFNLLGLGCSFFSLGCNLLGNGFTVVQLLYRSALGAMCRIAGYGGGGLRDEWQCDRDLLLAPTQ